MPEKAKERDKEHAVPPPQRGAPVDEVRPEKTREKPPLDVKLQHERMDSEGGGSAPMLDSPGDGDLRVERAPRRRRPEPDAEDEEG